MNARDEYAKFDRMLLKQMSFPTSPLLRLFEPLPEGDGLVNRSGSEKPANLAGNRDPHRTELHRNGGFLTVSEVANRLGWEPKAIYSLTRRRRANRGLLPLPHKKVGRKLYFEWNKVVEWLNRQPGVELPEKGSQE